MGENGDLVKV